LGPGLELPTLGYSNTHNTLQVLQQQKTMAPIPPKGDRDGNIISADVTEDTFENN